MGNEDDNNIPILKPDESASLDEIPVLKADAEDDLPLLDDLEDRSDNNDNSLQAAIKQLEATDFSTNSSSDQKESEFSIVDDLSASSATLSIDFSDDDEITLGEPPTIEPEHTEPKPKTESNTSTHTGIHDSLLKKIQGNAEAPLLKNDAEKHKGNPFLSNKTKAKLDKNKELLKKSLADSKNITKESVAVEDLAPLEFEFSAEKKEQEDQKESLNKTNTVETSPSNDHSAAQSTRDEVINETVNEVIDESIVIIEADLQKRLQESFPAASDKANISADLISEEQRNEIINDVIDDSIMAIESKLRKKLLVRLPDLLN